MYRQNINSVQSFVRLIVWWLVFLVTSLVMTLPLAAVSSSVFNSALVLATPSLIFNLWLASVCAGMIYILPEWERIVLLRLGKFEGVKGPGFFVIPPFIYSSAAIVDTRIETHQVEATATLTKDNVPTKVTAAVELKVEDARKAIIDVNNYRQSVIWMATEALKNTIGSMDLKELLAERDKIAKTLREQIDMGAAVYGIDIRAVRITDIDTPQSLVEELAAIARARRSAEAKQIEANAELEMASKIAEAGNILYQSPAALKLRELQLMSEMSKSQGTMIIVYPYGDRNGQEIAHGVAGANRTQLTRN